jgi:uncharacterized protein (TIGR03437 family)
MMEIIPHSQPATSSSESFRHRACGILSLFLALASAHAATTPALNVAISQETAPPGATVQIKLSLSAPAAVSSGELALDLDPKVFGPVTAIANFSAAGDASGYATINGAHLDIHFASPSATLGSAAGMPLIVITVPTLATASVSSHATVTADPTGSSWTDASGAAYSVTVIPGSVTLGGSLSVLDVSPVSNLASGAVVKIHGSGFTSTTTVDIAAASVASVQLVGPQEIDVTLAGAADLGGKQITVRNPGGSPVTFFAAPPATPLASIGDVFDGALPLFPTASYPTGAGGFLEGLTFGRMALMNPSATAVDVMLQVRDPVGGFEQMALTIPAGGAYNNDFRSLKAMQKFVDVIATAPLRMVELLGHPNSPQPTVNYEFSPFAPTSVPPPGVPVPVLGSVLNAASSIQGVIAPAEIITIRGFSLGSPGAKSAGTTFTLDSSGHVPVNLAGSEVLINGKPAPILYSSPSQINAIVPYEIAGQTAATVQVIYNGSGSQVWSFPVAPAAPGIFTLDSTGTGQAAVLNQDNSVNGPSQPAARGTVIQIFATGLPVAGAVTGSITPAAAPGSTDPVSVGIGGVTAPILYAGPAPGEVAGVIQVNAVVPDNAPTGPAVPIVLSVSPPQGPLQPIIYTSQAGATIGVQ